MEKREVEQTWVQVAPTPAMQMRLASLFPNVKAAGSSQNVRVMLHVPD